ncbi:peroxisome biogenesis factor 10-like [Adelges cooleyi]|uniref:peroxisome biogenesis factor 10-like n=1 Tax=Adelges cooleyi TaxID=133065 RepID=UPI00217F2D36|nr:peroxisome biogenesis factor 10-like [Adelges cooleyi]XP_050440127.1 peroxisome biogenesis factor 10-like [Adelges cooleyi]
MPAFNFSGPAEILRAEQKDEEQCEKINRQLSEFLLKLKGHIFINKNRKTILCASQMLYYGLTTLSRLQTLGEEYTRIVQVGKTGRHIPGFMQTIGMLSMFIIGDQLILRCIDYIADYIQANESITETAKHQIIHTLKIVKSILPIVQSFNRVLFYWNASFYTWSKRFFNIRYIFAVPWYRPSQSLHVFKILSIVSAIHISTLMLVSLSKSNDTETTDDDVVTEPTSDSNKCSLCLEMRTHTSLAVCGHLFCWNCIHEWLQTNKFCPLCRKVLDPRKIIPLQNYA